jgi:hypothetical protein
MIVDFGFLNEEKDVAAGTGRPGQVAEVKIAD